MSSNIIWTNHLEQRLLQRGISRNEAFDTIRYPQKSIRQSGNKWKLQKTYSHKEVTIIAVNENSQWVILTAWSKIPGEKNTYWQNKQYPWIQRFIQSLLVKLVHLIKNLFSKH